MRVAHPEAGLARRWTPDFRLTFTQAAEVLRAKISIAHYMPEEVAVILLKDDATRILNAGARSHLLDKIAEWQQGDLANGHLAVSIVGLQWMTDRSSRRSGSLQRFRCHRLRNCRKACG
jgi:hypothetical protein